MNDHIPSVVVTVFYDLGFRYSTLLSLFRALWLNESSFYLLFLARYAEKVCLLLEVTLIYLWLVPVVLTSGANFTDSIRVESCIYLVGMKIILMFNAWMWLEGKGYYKYAAGTLIYDN